MGSAMILNLRITGNRNTCNLNRNAFIFLVLLNQGEVGSRKG